MIYARHGSSEFNARLDEVLGRLASDVRGALGENLVALVLGGGYGRGEGAVLQEDGTERPYNDLDLALVVRRRGAVPSDSLSRIGGRYEKETGIHVDFSRPLTLGDVRRWPRWLMWYDLLHGHRVLEGPPDVLRENAPAGLEEPLPPIEAARLLLNRGAGLLWARRVSRGVEPSPDTDFVRRNYYKCALALGDASLIAHSRYATPYEGRVQRLERLTTEVRSVADLDLADLYRAATTFKFSPHEAPAVDLDDESLRRLGGRWGECFLHVERIRHGKAWQTVGKYVAWAGTREPEENAPGRWLRNMIRSRQSGGWSLRYPREGLYRRLPILLDLTEDRIQDWAAETERFLAVWRRCA